MLYDVFMMLVTTHLGQAILGTLFVCFALMLYISRRFAATILRCIVFPFALARRTWTRSFDMMRRIVANRSESPNVHRPLTPSGRGISRHLLAVESSIGAATVYSELLERAHGSFQTLLQLTSEKAFSRDHMCSTFRCLADIFPRYADRCVFLHPLELREPHQNFANSPTNILLDSRFGFEDFEYRLHRSIAHAAFNIHYVVTFQSMYPEIVISPKACSQSHPGFCESVNGYGMLNRIDSLFDERNKYNSNCEVLNMRHFSPTILEWMRTRNKLYLASTVFSLHIQRMTRDIVFSSFSTEDDLFLPFINTGLLMKGEEPLRDVWFRCLKTRCVAMQKQASNNDELLKQYTLNALDFATSGDHISSPVFATGLQFEVDFSHNDYENGSVIADLLYAHFIHHPEKRIQYVSLLMLGFPVCFREQVEYHREPFDFPMHTWPAHKFLWYLCKKLVFRLAVRVLGPRYATYHICVSFVKSYDTVQSMVGRYGYSCQLAAPMPNIFWGEVPQKPSNESRTLRKALTSAFM